MSSKSPAAFAKCCSTKICAPADRAGTHRPRALVGADRAAGAGDLSGSGDRASERCIISRCSPIFGQVSYSCLPLRRWRADRWFQSSPARAPRRSPGLMQSVDDRAAGYRRGVDPSGGDPRAVRQRAGSRASTSGLEMQKIGLTDIRTDDSVERQRRSQGNRRWPDRRVRGPHGHRLPGRHRSEGEARWRHPARAGHRRRHLEPDGGARDVPRPQSRRRSDERRPRLPRVGSGGSRVAGRQALARDERLQARHVRRRGCLVEPSVVRRAPDRPFKFFYTSPGAHTMESRGGPSPAEGRRQGDHRALRHAAAARSPRGSTPSSCR